jgi:Flp pilus assembly protein TadG
VSIKKAMTHGKGRGAAGQELVELAIVLPLVLLMLLGAIDLGRLAYLAQQVTNAARAGALYGAQTQATAGNTAGIIQKARDDASVTLTSVTASKACRCSNWGSSPDRANCSPVPNCGTSAFLITYVSVTSSVNYAPWFPYPGIPGNAAVTQTVSMRVGQ